jgi:antitoxin MazE
MQTQIKKWGNSLALRIPKLFAIDANLKINKVVDISIDKGSIIITPIDEKEYSLKKLLEGVTENNLHKEFDTGAQVGKEIW